MTNYAMTKTLADEFTIQDDFPPVGYDQWRALADEALQGASFERKLVTHTREGIDLQPIYARRDQLSGIDPLGFPGLPPFVRGSHPLGYVLTGWDLQQEHAHPDLAMTNRAILDDLEGGVTSLLLRFDAAARNGFDSDQAAAANLAGRDGVLIFSLDDLDAALANVHLNLVGIALDACAAFLPAAAMLVGLWQRREVSQQDARGAFNADPFAALARDGQLPVSPTRALAALADLAKWTVDRYPHVTAVGVDTMPYQDAGATAAQDIAFGTATAVEYLRTMTSAELDIDSAARQILFRIGLGTHHFLAIAKLRAARRVWSRVIEACGGSPESGAMRIHARTSNRVLTERDPDVNLLRNTVAMFAAGVGGANVLTSVPFDAMIGLPDEFSRRVARNTVRVLQEEAHLHRVIDPAGGSWFLDQLTEQLADKAWEIFQEIERRGGMLAALKSEWVAEQIDPEYAPRAKDIARGEPGSQKPDDFGYEIAAIVEAASAGATIGQMARAMGFHETPTETISPFELRNYAELLQDEEGLERHGN